MTKFFYKAYPELSDLCKRYRFYYCLWDMSGSMPPRQSCRWRWL